MPAIVADGWWRGYVGFDGGRPARHYGDEPAFLTALNIKTGQAAWQHRGFGRASMLYAADPAAGSGQGKAIIMDEDGDLALAKLAPEGVTILSEAKKIFDTAE